jgi:anti-sigma B factor antagonist
MSDQGASLAIVVNVDGWTITGEIDAHSAPSLASAMSELPDVDTVVADVTDVTFMDSSGLRVFADAARHAIESNKTLVIAHPRTAIRRVVEISGLSDYLRLLD